MNSLIQKVEAKNFQSWANLSFEFTPGTTLIEGFNFDDGTAEGVGKSAVLNALCWGLYGKLPKDTNIDDVIRHGEQGCEVEVTLASGVRLVRTRKPNRLYMIDPNGTKRLGQDAKETQALIEGYLGLGFDAFVQSVYFAQNYPKKFLTSNEEEKAKILSEILDLEIFTRARKRAHDELKPVVDAQTALTFRISSGEQVLAAAKRKVQELKELRVRLSAEQAERVRKLTERHDLALSALHDAERQLEHYDSVAPSLESKLQELGEAQAQRDQLRATLQASIAGFKDYQQRITAANEQMDAAQADLAEVAQDLHAYQNPKDKKCRACGTVLEKADPDHFKPHIERLQAKAEAIRARQAKAFAELQALKQGSPDVTQQRADLDLVTQEATRVRSEEQRLRLELSKRSVYAERRNLAERQVKQAEADVLAEQQKDLKHMASKEAQAEAEVGEQVQALVNLRLDRDALDAAAQQLTRLKEGFREVKSYVFRGALGDLTRRANAYLVDLFEVPATIEFSNSGEEGEVAKIQAKIWLDGVERSLGLLSGGQARRVQLSVDLALSDLVSSRSFAPMGLKIFDESLKDLSEESMSRIIGLLQRLKGSVVLIEHNSAAKSIVQRSFRIAYENGVSRQVE